MARKIGFSAHAVPGSVRRLCGAYISCRATISFLYGPYAMLPDAVRRLQQYDQGTNVMSLTSTYHAFAGRDDVAATTSAIMADIFGSSRRESPVLERGYRRARIEALMRSEARIDAALELVALELPQWQLRRLAYDAGEWHCALSRMRELPDWLDRSVEAHHADLALAILEACMEARRSSASRSTPSVPHVPPPEASAATPFCCDNFS